jgi:signal transduction histidine kinase
LNNILKHARASEIQIGLNLEVDRYQLTIRDNGVGFEPESIENYGGYGLANMRDRLQKINGTLTIDSQQGKGTTLNIEVIP